MTPSPSKLAIERLAAVALLAAAVTSLFNVPSTRLPPAWVLAFTLPGAAFGLLPRQPRWPTLRAFGFLILQAAACFTALKAAGPLSRPAALACTALPPMAFVCIRRRDADAALGLFLTFCVAMVGVVLGGPHLAALAAYAIAACAALRAESLLQALQYSRHRTVGGGIRTGTILASAISLALVCITAAFALQRTLGTLPSPSLGGSAPTAAKAAAADRMAQGLDDSFVLDGMNGILADLHGEQLVRVRSLDAGGLRHDLYLRTAFFAVAALDRWEIGAVDLEPTAEPDGRRLHRPLPGSPVQWLEIERYAGASRFVPMPPGSCEVRDLPGARFDATREFLGQDDADRSLPYRIAYQDLPQPQPDLDVDQRAERLGLLALPDDFDGRAYASLLARWRVRGSALQIAARIQDGLGRHCRYERMDPVGPSPHAIENFLFADGDRYGYCMHFASAAALLLRMCGVPCRVAVGLYGGAADAADPAARIYGSQHAHAWVEIPFPGRGYWVFDPTPSEYRGVGGPREAEAAASAVEGDDSVAAALAQVFAWLGNPWLLAALLAAVVILAVRPGRRLANAVAPERPELRVPRRLLAALLAELARAGHRRAPRQTLERFADELARHDRLLPEFAAAFVAYQEVRFGGRTWDTPRQSTLEAAHAAARALPSAATTMRVPAPESSR